MSIHRLSRPAAALLSLVALFLVAPAAKAGPFSIVLTQSGVLGSWTAVDNVSNDLNPIAGIITTAGSFGSFSFNVTATTVFSSPTTAQLNLTVTTISRTSTANLNPLVMDVITPGFTVPGTTGSTMQVTSSVSSSVIGINPSGPLNNFALDSFIDSTQAAAHTVLQPGGPSGAAPFDYVRGSSFFVESKTTVNLFNVTSINFSYTLTVVEKSGPSNPVPEPASVAMALGAAPMILACLVKRRRARRKD